MLAIALIVFRETLEAALFVGKTISKTREGKESNLVKLGRSMGVVEPEKGFDPDMLLGKFFMVVTEFQDGRSWARNVFVENIVAPSPAAPKAPPPPPKRPAAPKAEPADDTRWQFHAGGEGVEWEEVSAKDIKAWLAANPTRADAAFVAPADGSGEAKGWKEYGFADPLPY